MLALAYYGLSLYAIVFVIFIFYSAEKQAGNSLKVTKLTAGLILGWLAYIILLIQSGLLLDYSLPPRFPLLVIVPFIMICVWVYRKLSRSELRQHLPAKALVYFQTFRVLVEIMLYYTFVAGIIPESATFEGLNFDIVMGASAPLVGLFIYRKLDKRQKRIAIAWNILGIGMILFVAVIIGTSMYFPALWGSESQLVSDAFLSFPVFLIAGCIAPFAILVHVIALAGLKE